MIIPFFIRYKWKVYESSERATRYSRMKSTAGAWGFLLGFLSFCIAGGLLSELLPDEDTAYVLGLVIGISAGIVFTVWLKKRFDKKIAAALKEDAMNQPWQEDLYPDFRAADRYAGCLYAGPDYYMEKEKKRDSRDFAPESATVPSYDLWLVCEDGYMKGRVYPITQEAITIGRDLSSKLRYPEDFSGVSSKHAKLYWDNGRLMLMDLNSARGTFVNGLGRIPPMRATEILPGQRFSIAGEKESFLIQN